VDRADALRLQRRAEYARTVQGAFGEVLDALQGQRSLGSIQASAAERAAALARATELAELRYRDGDTPIWSCSTCGATCSSPRSI
jgi:outer membrane protein TolC